MFKYGHKLIVIQNYQMLSENVVTGKIITRKNDLNRI